MDVDYMIMQSNKSINTSKHTYTGTMVETPNFFWIASKHYKYAILRQSLSTNLRFPGLTLTQELEGTSVEFISYCIINLTIHRSWHGRSKMQLTPTRIIQISSRRFHNLSLVHGLWAVLISSRRLPTDSHQRKIRNRDFCRLWASYEFGQLNSTSWRGVFTAQLMVGHPSLGSKKKLLELV